MISILMTVYKEPWDWVRKSLDSINSQTFKDFELILVVDNPNYQYVDLLRNYLQKKFNKYHLIINKKI
ncbi:glycosyltransferase [Lactiplantibacillus carotarum]|uniref:glycosyltransferase n=1 Tax=Lactiplantibacillus carotarum TaxID=2993456 RepID=UPI00384D0D03